MIYINALNLINLCVENEILKEEEGKIFVNKSGNKVNKAGWYLIEKDIIAKELMKSEEGQKKLIETLKKKNVDFIPKDYSWMK